jgi:DNA-directed RNA polymerase beta subunit
MRVPYLTQRSTVIHNGSEYSIINQARLDPGIYSRRKENGDIEAHVNAAMGKGAGRGFRVRFEPQTGQFKMDIGQSSLHLYSLLKDIGYPEDKMKEAWGEALFNQNKEGYDARVLNKAFTKFTREVPDLEVQHTDKVNGIIQSLNNTKVRKDVVSKTLHKAFNA